MAGHDKRNLSSMLTTLVWWQHRVGLEEGCVTRFPWGYVRQQGRHDGDGGEGRASKPATRASIRDIHASPCVP